MKRYVKALSAIALLLALSLNVKPALAYFTTYTLARGVQQIKLGDTTEIRESYKDYLKSIQVTNTDGPDSCYVRLKVYFDTAVEGVSITMGGANWKDGGDGYYYWIGGNNGELPMGASTDDPFTVKVTAPKKDDPNKPEEYDEFSVIIVYECAPIEYNEDGSVKVPDGSLGTWELEFTEEKRA